MKYLKKAFRIVLLFVLVIALYLIGVILYGTITEYKPTPETNTIAIVDGNVLPSTQIDSTINLMIWNLGYGGLGKETDFFYDGGKMVRAPREIWDKDFKGQLNMLTSNDTIDFFMLQEIDLNSSRSYHVNQYDSVNHVLSNYAASFGMNYDVNFVPVPYTKPMGKVTGGLATFSKYQPTESKRYQYPGKFPWPTRIFFLDRCFLAQRYPLAGGKELVLINTHNSAYDETGEIKNAEMQYLKSFVEAEYKKGNYVIAGGDWNQCPPTYKKDFFAPIGGYDGFMPPAMSYDYTPENWLWAYDPATPTNRHVETPLNDKTFKTLIDFYLISPNLELKVIKTIDTQFEYSDHQPVLMQVKLM